MGVFLFAGSVGSSECLFLLKTFEELARELGVPLTNEKTEGLIQCITFWGVEIDAVTRTSRLPIAKLVALKSMLREFLGKRKVTLHELQQLVGYLSFTCKVVVPGRAFLRRLWASMVGI